MNTKCFKIILIALISINVVNLFAQEEVRLRPHEEWWENNYETHGQDFKQWLGDVHASSRVAMRAHVRAKGYQSILDIPCGLCVDHDGFKVALMDIEYQGIDITPKLIKAAQDRGVSARQGSIENIPLNDSLVDVTYARHILEHLDYYKDAIKELIRVARKEVLIIFFIKPSHSPDFIDGQANGNTQGYLIYHNVYNKDGLENYLKTFKKVSGFEWQDIDAQEIMLHIYLNPESIV